ncbi:hypothetical protein [Streptomyces sp. NPDC006551]|uniref:hypothetical protein n=1 Tax=Streptomyces sp. NPDC006551 TaxID=3157178 RepID=UPI0033A1E15A
MPSTVMSEAGVSGVGDGGSVAVVVHVDRRRRHDRDHGELGEDHEQGAQLPVVRGQLIDSSDEVLDVGPQLCQFVASSARSSFSLTIGWRRRISESGVCPRALTGA